ncbi:putative steroid-binding protein 3 [Ceratocystis fimbriata CBS 114723]|uniref:Putative steroid-binding protein 3 n=1 Tax=Ceratocystis fimbriata CBS 114723 TaxID=1035309 RepID=A0A2C5WD69_9PEZI|nr:putative steroid-binding protein 3 [Ceratocystis fimbriata CBS 114723]
MAGKFEPKTPVDLAPPKDDLISLESLAEANGRCIRRLYLRTVYPALTAVRLGAEGSKCYVAIKGIVYDVTGNKSYQPGGAYAAFAGKDASRALAKVSTKDEDVKSEWQDLTDKEKSTLNDWVTFFSKRYNVVGLVKDATNMEK